MTSISESENQFENKATPESYFGYDSLAGSLILVFTPNGHEIFRNPSGETTIDPLIEEEIIKLRDSALQFGKEQSGVRISESGLSFKYQTQTLFDENRFKIAVLIILKNISHQAPLFDAAWLSDSKIRLITDNIPQLVWVKDTEANTLYVNRRWLEFTGRPLEFLPFKEWLQFLWPTDATEVEKAWLEIIAQGADYEGEYRIRRHDGSYHWFVSRGLPVRDESGKPIFWFGTCTDIDSQKRAEITQRTLAKVSEKIREASSPQDLLNGVVTILGKDLDVSRCTFGEVDIKSNTITVYSAYCKNNEKFAGTFFRPDFGKIIDLIGAGTPVAISDTKNDPLTASEYDKLYARYSIAAGIFVPIVRRGQQVATLVIHETRGPRVWDKTEIELAEKMAERAWLAFENARLIRVAEESEKTRQKFLVEVLKNVTDGKFRLCFDKKALPEDFALYTQQLRINSETALKVMRDTVEMFADRAAFPAERKYDLITATGEAAMNAIVHGGEGVAIFSANEESIMVRIQDSGPGIEIDRIPQATLEKGYTTAGSFGHGFKLMLKMIDRLWLLTGQEGTTVILEQSRNESQPDWFKALLDSSPDNDQK